MRNICAFFKKLFDTKGEPLLRARRTGLIPKEGVLADGIRYNFHGGDCFFEFTNGAVDVDFGPNDRCDGFDCNRLYDFLEALISYKDSLLLDNYKFINQFNSLVLNETIISPNWYHNPDLFYLKEPFSKSAGK